MHASAFAILLLTPSTTSGASETGTRAASVLMPSTATQSPVQKHMAALRSVTERGGVRWGYFKGISAKNLRLHLKVLDIEEVYFFAMAFQELETVR